MKKKKVFELLHHYSSLTVCFYLFTSESSHLFLSAFSLMRISHHDKLSLFLFSFEVTSHCLSVIMAKPCATKHCTASLYSLTCWVLHYFF